MDKTTFKIEFKRLLEQKKRKTKICFNPPPYDDIYYEGLKVLNYLAKGVPDNG